MAAISLGSIISGLPKDIVERLMEVERQPLKALERRKKNEESRLNLVADLTTRLKDANVEFEKLGRFRHFRVLNSLVGRPEVMDVEVDNDLAEPAEYSIEVSQLAGRSSMLSNGFEDPNDTQIGVGYFSYELPNGDVNDVFIDEDNNTLHGIANKLNNQSELDLQALVVDDGTGDENPWRLIITHGKSGEINDAEFPTFYFVDGDEDFYLDKERPSQNSIVKINGFDMEFQGTRVESLIPGVSLDLKEAQPGKEFSLKIFEDFESAEGKVKSIVEKLNAILQFIQGQNKIDEKTLTSETLGGDVTIQNLESLIRKMVIKALPTTDGSIRFNEIGVTFQRTGLLEVDENKLKRVVRERFRAVGEFFAGIKDNGQGFVGTLTKAVKGYVQTGGIVASRSDGIKRRIKDIDLQIENKEKHLEQVKAGLKRKFAKLESTMARLKGQQGQLAALGGGGTNALGQMNLGTVPS